MKFNPGDLRSWFSTNDMGAVLIVRIVLGYVFLVAGLQKFIFPDDMGPGRFAEMGYTFPAFTAYFVGFFETAGAVLILLGLATRFAAIPLIIIMLTAIATTKFPVLADDGFWSFAHALRLDFSMLLCALFMWFAGADKRSLDCKLSNR